MYNRVNVEARWGPAYHLHPHEMKIIDAFVNDGFLNQRVSIDVPLDYGAPLGAKITIVANVTQKHDPAIHTLDKVTFPDSPKVIGKLQGGPGFLCDVPTTNSGFVKVLISNGYQVVLYDQRGTGLSTPIDVDTLDMTQLAEQLEQYLLHFRADSIVRDMEQLRNALIGERKWLLLGQSYGGFCSFTYLSLFPDALENVLITGGVPPVGFSADDVYAQTYKRTAERNAHFYRKYPQDVQRVRDIVAYLSLNEVRLPNGGRLSVERFQQLGIMFGGQGGTDALHQLVVELHLALEQFGKPTFRVLLRIEASHSFETNILYALFQEAIYCDGAQRSNWAAERARHAVGNEAFVALSGPVYFTGEMVYKSMYEDYARLRPLKRVAELLHERTLWSALYKPEVLKTITWAKVPIVAATYYNDQYVDFELTKRVKDLLFGEENLRQYVTSEFFHNGLRANPDKVVGLLLKLLENEVD